MSDGYLLDYRVYDKKKHIMVYWISVVCHTDVFWLSGAIGQIDPNTFILGHEIAGVVIK